jgi:hypothetical protein
MPKEVKDTKTGTAMVVHKPKKVVTPKKVIVKNDLPKDVAPGNIKIKVLKSGGNGYLVAFFHPEVTGWINPELLPEISLARISGRCMYRLDKLHEHDFHAPPFHSDADCDLYILRVLKDISEAKCDGAHIEVEIMVNDKPLQMEEPDGEVQS